MKSPDLSDRLLKFSASVIRLLEHLPDSMSMRRISDQLIRSAMSVGANYEEARGANSRADFCNKLQIAFKEMRETRYWLGLIAELEACDPNRIGGVLGEATQLRAILAKSVATARKSGKQCGA